MIMQSKSLSKRRILILVVVLVVATILAGLVFWAVTTQLDNSPSSNTQVGLDEGEAWTAGEAAARLDELQESPVEDTASGEEKNEYYDEVTDMASISGDCAATVAAAWEIEPYNQTKAYNMLSYGADCYRADNKNTESSEVLDAIEGRLATIDDADLRQEVQALVNRGRALTP